MNHTTFLVDPDIVLIGSGIMSANLAVLLKRLEPNLRIQIIEVTDTLAQESSYGWNNAGTGHAGICELSYTPNREADGSVNVSKVVEIFAQFDESKQFWASAVEEGLIDSPKEFIRPVPHMSFVHGQEQVDFLRARFEGMSQHHFFRTMEYSTDREKIGQWAPLLTAGRGSEPIAATRMEQGTDVNFGAVSRKLLEWLSKQEGCGIVTGHRVVGLIERQDRWELSARNLATGEIHNVRTKFVFVGAGGGSLTLLQKSGIPEAKGLGGFPIGGQWLVCDNPDIVRQHQAKIYGQALDAAPTMAVPHLDTRILDGKKTLLFGPFAAWTTKFLHEKGSYFDLPLSVKPDNLATLIKIGLTNLDLVRYLIQQGTQSMADRMSVLRVFYPAAEAKDWRLVDAGIRVQAIKKTDGEAGIVHYGTEVITNADRTISALLGASPGASVSVHIVLQIVKLCFPQLTETPEGKERLDRMIPSWNFDARLPGEAERVESIRTKVDMILELD